MLLIIKFLSKSFAVLNSEVSPSQIAAGFAFGAIIGLVPVGSLLPFALLFLAFVVNINIPIMFVGSGIFKILSFALDPVANQIGYAFLVKMTELAPFWTKLYNAPVIPYTKFNNTIVLGSFLLGLAFFIPLFIAGRVFVAKYRTTWKEKFLRLRIVQIVKASTFYKYYLTYKGLRGE